MMTLVRSLLERTSGEQRGTALHGAMDGATAQAFLGAALSMHRLRAGLGAALVLCNVATAQAVPSEVGTKRPHLLGEQVAGSSAHTLSSGTSQRLARQGGIAAPGVAPAEPSLQSPMADEISGLRIQELIDLQRRSLAGSGLERIEALLREGEPLSMSLLPLPNVPLEAQDLLAHAYVNGEEIWKELLQLPRVAQSQVLHQAVLWLHEYRKVDPDQSFDIPAMIARIPAREPLPGAAQPAPGTTERSARARLLELVEQGENEAARRAEGATTLPQRIVLAYPQSGPEMVGLIEALTSGEQGLLATPVGERLRPLRLAPAPRMPNDTEEEPVTFIPSTMPTDPELLLFTAFEQTSSERIEIYRSASAASRHAMRAQARLRINEAMNNAAEQEAARAAARERGTTPPVMRDPRLIGPEIITFSIRD